MPEQPIAFQSYQSRSAPYSNQRLINLYYELGVEGTKTPGILYRRPGLELLTTLSSSFVRGIHTMNGIPFIVCGTLVYTLDQAGVATILPGNVAGTDLVDMADNGEQVAIVAGELGYIATTSEVVQITDENFRLVSSVEFQDGYFIWTEKDSARFFLSPLFNGLNGYDPLDFTTAEYAPDNLVKVFSDHGDLFLFGTESVEVWRNTGGADFPYTALSGAAMEVGVISRDSVSKIDNSIAWLGRDERGGVTVWRANGYTPQRVSTHALENNWDGIEDLNQSYAFTMRLSGHAFYVLTVRNRGTWVYDAATQLWHEWQTNGAEDFKMVGFGFANNRHIIGDREGDKLYSMTNEAFDDNGEDIIWEATSPVVATENNALARHNFVRVDAVTGQGPVDGDEPEIWLQWADEDGDRFNSPKLMSMGKRGNTRHRAFLRRLGQARARTYRIRGSDPIPLALMGSYLDIDGGAY